MRWELIQIEWLADVSSQWCLPFPLKPTSLSRAMGKKGGGQADGWPNLLVPSSNKPGTKEAASDNTNSTMIGSDQSQSGSKMWRRDYRLPFFCPLVLIKEGWEWLEKVGGGGLPRQEVFQQTNIKITKQIQLDLLETNKFQSKITNLMNGGTDNKNMRTNT